MNIYVGHILRKNAKEISYFVFESHEIITVFPKIDSVFFCLNLNLEFFFQSFDNKSLPLSYYLSIERVETFHYTIDFILILRTPTSSYSCPAKVIIYLEPVFTCGSQVVGLCKLSNCSDLIASSHIDMFLYLMVHLCGFTFPIYGYFIFKHHEY